MKNDLKIEFIKKVAATNPDVLIAELLDCYDIIEKLSTENSEMRKHIYQLTKEINDFEPPKCEDKNPKTKEDLERYLKANGSAAAGPKNPDKDANKQAVTFTRNDNDDFIRMIFESLIG